MLLYCHSMQSADFVSFVLFVVKFLLLGADLNFAPSRLCERCLLEKIYR
jgi:hypothetical protein